MTAGSDTEDLEIIAWTAAQPPSPKRTLDAQRDHLNRVGETAAELSRSLGFMKTLC